MKLKKKIALIAVGSLVGVGGLYAVSSSATAAAPTITVQAAPAVTFPVPVLPVAETDVEEGTQNGIDDSSEVEDSAYEANALQDGYQDSESVDDATEIDEDATEIDEDATEIDEDATESSENAGE